MKNIPGTMLLLENNQGVMMRDGRRILKAQSPFRILVINTSNTNIMAKNASCKVLSPLRSTVVSPAASEAV